MVPITAFAVWMMFGSAPLALFSLLEQTSAFAILPSATIAWAATYGPTVLAAVLRGSVVDTSDAAAAADGDSSASSRPAAGASAFSFDRPSDPPAAAPGKGYAMGFDLDADDGGVLDAQPVPLRKRKPIVLN
eukprot:PLAT7791.2.p1 GENE.PLAT7791.2~~PLAT7791.2.p1  ORF type:complete len:132 (+),score=32.03 PLAT7791.2:1-396(+)